MVRKIEAAGSLLEDGLSIVMPAYNAADWLAPTTQKIATALSAAKLRKAEIIIVDDGSSDHTKAVIKELSDSYEYPVVGISQQNAGRFLARKAGVMKARYDTILFVDTRVWIDESSLAFVAKQHREHPERIVWNGHVNVAKKGNIIARFGDSLTNIGWRRYFRRPQLSSYGLTDFDYYPKGTGFFLAPTKLIKASIEWFEQQTHDLRNSSDDTLLIRHIAQQTNIWLSPEFSCTYYARTTLRAFIKHTYYRGQFFVDGFLRKGTRFYYPLLAFIILCPCLLVSLVIFPSLVACFITLALVLWLAEFILTLLLGLSVPDAFSLFLLSPIFVLVYGAGIWRAFIRRAVQHER